MTFKECVAKYPINDTKVGNYYSDQEFTISKSTDIENIKSWNDPPLEWDECDAYPFVTYDDHEDKFICWTFAFVPVKGYANQTNDPNSFEPMTYNEDCGWEPIQEGDIILTPDLDLMVAMNWPRDKIRDYFYRREQAAYEFDPDSYYEGHTFTTYEQLKKFVEWKNNR